MAANKQLTKIVAPNINEVDYAGKMQEVFDNINENFAKIASLPFIQGVQGDSYKMVTKYIFEYSNKVPTNSDANWIVTEDGAILLNSIFSRNDIGTENKKTLYQIKRLIGNVLGKKSPLDFYKEYIEAGTSEHKITNNELYFYVIENDEGEEFEKQLGQYYYFIDGRLSVLGTLYNNNSNSFSDFSDYTGFYQYIPISDENSTAYYKKVDLLPSIYYDRTKNDICWKFSGVETGISAIGITGAAGKDSNFQIILVDIGSNNPNELLSHTVDAIFNFNTSNDSSQGWDYTKTGLQEGFALIVIQSDVNSLTGKENYIAYGQVKIQDNDWVASWNKDTITDLVQSNIKINNYFYNMGSNTNNYPRFLAIPSDEQRTNNSKSAHIIRTQFSDDNSKVEGTKNLIIRHTNEAWDSSLRQKSNPSANPIYNPDTGNKKIYLDNYDLELKQLDDTSNNQTNKLYTSIKHGKLSIHGTNNKDALEVIGNTKLNGELNVTNHTTIGGNLTIPKGIVTIGSNRDGEINEYINIGKTKKDKTATQLKTNIYSESGNQKAIITSICSDPEGSFDASSGDSTFGKYGSYLDLVSGNNQYSDSTTGLRIQNVGNEIKDKAVIIKPRLVIDAGYKEPSTGLPEYRLEIYGGAYIGGKLTANNGATIRNGLDIDSGGIKIFGKSFLSPAYAYANNDSITSDIWNNWGNIKVDNLERPVYSTKKPYMFCYIKSDNYTRVFGFDADVYPENSIVIVYSDGNKKLNILLNMDTPKEIYGLNVYYLNNITFTQNIIGGKSKTFRNVFLYKNIAK